MTTTFRTVCHATPANPISREAILDLVSDGWVQLTYRNCFGGTVTTMVTRDPALIEEYRPGSSSVADLGSVLAVTSFGEVVWYDRTRAALNAVHPTAIREIALPAM